MTSQQSEHDSEAMEGAEKLVVIGDASVGKTCLVTRFVTNTFTENVKPTIGCDHFDKDVLVNTSKVRLSIWDTAGQERFRGLSNSYYKKARCIIIIYDITRKSSFEKIEFWREEITNFGENDPIKILVGTKLDLQDKRAVQRDDAVNYSNKHKFAYFTEVSSLDNQNNAIQELFKKAAELILEKVTNEANSNTNIDKPKKDNKNVTLVGEDKKDEEGCKC